MKNRWTLHVKGLGKIKETSITVAPLTLFVGDNNSGKSYLMELLYTLLNIRFYAHKYDMCMESIEYQACADEVVKYMNDCHDKGKFLWKISEASQKNFEGLLNKILNKNAEKLSRRAFNENVPIEWLSIEFPHKVQRKIQFSYQEDEDEAAYFIRPSNYNRARLRKNGKATNVSFFVGFLLEYMLKQDFKKTSMDDALYLPSSRTGFLLTYKSLINASLSDTYDDGETVRTQGKLTRPCSDFLKNLARISPEGKTDKFAPIVQFIEKEMVCGHVSLSGDTPQAAVRYRPRNQDIDLPMHLSSGVVTELAPLLLLLGYHEPVHTIFMEEPEMGLHPKFQVLIAQAIIRIRNMGVAMFITTHSDNILQHINNMIKLNGKKTPRKEALMKKYGYDSLQDTLSKNDVAMYQFDTQEGATYSIVHPLTCNDYGFEVPSFNDALRDLLQESRDFETEEDESDE